MKILWPILLSISANAMYQLCARSSPSDSNPFAFLTVTYVTSALVSFAALFLLRNGETLSDAYIKVNWTAVVLGVSIVAFELGNIFMYRVGWNMSTGPLLQSVLSAALFMLLGALLFHEAITWNRIVGFLICAVGLVFMNR